MKNTVTTLIVLFMFIDCYSQSDKNLDTYGGILAIKGEKTGWFHTQKLNGRWYFVTPEGNAFFSIGATHSVECIKLDEQNLFETK
jgi:hypothetical protein